MTLHLVLGATISGAPTKNQNTDLTLNRGIGKKTKTPESLKCMCVRVFFSLFKRDLVDFIEYLDKSDKAVVNLSDLSLTKDHVSLL